MEAAALWREGLAAWRLPDELLAAAASSPYAWSPEQYTRRGREDDPDTGTAGVIRSLLAPDASLLDVGAGTGRVSLPFAAAGHPVTGVEPDAGMAAAFREHSRGMAAVRLVEGRWPDVAADVAVHDVVICANVVYDVPEVVGFLAALHDHAAGAVVVELTPEHPWADLAPYFRALHGLELPERPTVEDLMQVVREAIGVVADRLDWSAPGVRRFADERELLDFFGRRLLVPVGRQAELAELLRPHIIEEDGLYLLGAGPRRRVTLWWEV